jgi:hypothetical protein
LRRRTTRLDFCTSQKLTLPREAGGAFSQRIQWLDTPHPGPPPQGGREGNARGWSSGKRSADWHHTLSPQAGGEREILRHSNHLASCDVGGAPSPRPLDVREGKGEHGAQPNGSRLLVRFHSLTDGLKTPAREACPDEPWPGRRPLKTVAAAARCNRSRRWGGRGRPGGGGVLRGSRGRFAFRWRRAL